MTFKAPQRAGVQMPLQGVSDIDPEQPWQSDEWATPWPLFASLEQEFGPFDLDAAATPRNAKVGVFYTKADDGLKQPWRGAVWLNPPFSDIAPWLRRAHQHALAGGIVIVVVPVRTDMDWWHDDLWPYAEVRFLRGRQRFIGPDGTTIGRPSYATAIAVFDLNRKRS